MRRTLLVLMAATVSGCRDPRAEANIAQAMMDVGNTLASMQQDYAMLQSTVDSLHTIVARQDTLISRMASHVGMPIGPR